MFVNGFSFVYTVIDPDEVPAVLAFHRQGALHCRAFLRNTVAVTEKAIENVIEAAITRYVLERFSMEKGFLCSHCIMSKCEENVTFKAYMDNIQTKTGRTSEDFWKIANEKGFIEDGKIVAKHADLLKWLKSEVGLGHVHANFIILYLRLRTNDPKVSEQSRKWADNTGYKK